MSDTSGLETDTRPSLVICAWSPEETGWDPVEDLSGEPWSPAGARTDPVPAEEPVLLFKALAAKLADRACRALLLVGRAAQGDDFLLQLRAEKRAAPGDIPDAEGPGVVRATAPAAEMVQAMREAGLPARVTSQAEEDDGSYLLYRILAGVPVEADVPAVALLRAPSGASDAQMRRAVKAAAQAIAGRLSPLPRTHLA